MLNEENKSLEINFVSVSDKYDIVKIKKTKRVCDVCESFASEKLRDQTPIAILSCEGACLRGDVSRRAANKLCFSLMPERTVRICLGGAFIKNGGQRKMVESAKRVIALEGCFIECASKMMMGVLEDLKPEIIHVDSLYEFDRSLYGINDVTESELDEFASVAANSISQLLK
ncbi:MAG: putative zinc-binding protein [Candidatus Kapabacteria bacterium]|nr:putative zinc-binding protein [Candidatus Kapabacteria bacterium]